jgi:hypothetical protein
MHLLKLAELVMCSSTQNKLIALVVTPLRRVLTEKLIVVETVMNVPS